MKRLLLGAMLFAMAGSVQNLWAQYEGNTPFCHQGGGLLINEISSGPTTGQNNKEYIELIVTPDPANPLAPVNLEGWILDDNNVAISGEGNASGHFLLGDCYQAVPPGSILVVFNPADRNPDIPADDPTDADQDGVYIIPADNACVRVCNSNPTTSDSNYCPCSDPAAPASAWQIGLRNPGDLFQVRDDCETVVHAISWGSLQLAPEVQSSPVYFRLNGDNQSGLVIRFTNFVDNDWNDPTNYDNPSVITGQTPGAPNNTANADFIQLLRSGNFSECSGTIYDCKIADAGDLQAPNGISTFPLVLCQGEDLEAFSANYDQADENQPQVPGLNFEYAFLLTGDEAPDYPLLDFNLDGDFDFTNLPAGNYRIWGFSFIQTNGSVSVSDFLTSNVASIGDILAFSACGYDSNLDSLDQNAQVVAVQVVDSPTATAPADPLRACSSKATASFNLTAYDPLISGTSSLPVVWYRDVSATQAIANPTGYVAPAGTVFARLETGSCISNTVSVALEINNLGLKIQVDQVPDCDTPLGAISLNLNDTGNLNINWNVDSWDGSTVLTGLAPGTYSVTVTDANGGCQDSTSVRLNPGGTTVAEFLTVDPTCVQPNGGSIKLVQIIGGSGPYQISFDGVNFLPVANWSKSGLSAGTYTIILRDGSGCEIAQTVYLRAPAALSFDLGRDLELQAGESAVITPSANFPIASMSLTPMEGITAGPNGIVVQPEQTTTYTVTVTTKDGCSVSDQITITVIPPDEPPVPQLKIFIPNAFSPNEDGVNDTFTVFAGDQVISIKSMRIFDRWGNLLFEQEGLAPNDIQQGWRGELRGRLLPMGAYIYFIELDMADGTTEIFKGEITIVR